MAGTFARALVVTLSCFGAPAGALAQGTPQQVYAIVVDDDGFPVRGLSAEDFSLRDGSVRQGVLGAEAATNPVWLGVVVRGFGPDDLADVRRAIEGLAAVVRSGPSGSRTGVVRATAGGTREWVEVTPNLPESAWSTFLAAGSGSVVDAAASAADALRRAPTDRRAVVLLLKRTPGDALVEPKSLLTDHLFNNGASLWTVEVPASAAPRSATAPPRNAVKLDDVLSDATKFSGSLRERVAGTAAMAPMAERVARLMLAQYIVSYLWPNPMLSTFSIATRHDRGGVLVPAWAR